MAEAPRPQVGIEAADNLILKALDDGLQFPPGVSRWRLLAWAAEALELQRLNPTDFARDGFRRVWQQHFGPFTRTP